MSTADKIALCCSCGATRQCRRPRNYRQENYYLQGPVDQDWHRETGDLKCAACGRVTRHAILHPTADNFRNHAESMQLVALGWTNKRLTEAEQLVIRRQYRAAFPRNPFTGHIWWKSYEDDARAAGKTMFPAMCGEMVPVPETRSKGYDITELRPPQQITEPEMLEHERLDVETGLWWDIGDCVNCLHLRNARLLKERREELATILMKASIRTDKLDASLVDSLLTTLRELADQ